MIIKNNRGGIANYLSDAANFSGYCERVIIPESLHELIATVKKANNNRVKLTISGNGTGLTGGRVPRGGWVLSMERLNKIIEINAEKNFAIVQAGVILDEFQKEISNANLFYPPDPTETNCFIGSNVALNSSGARTFKYGPTRNFVLELKIVLPDGNFLQIKRGEFFSSGNKAKLISAEGKEYSFTLPSYKMPSVKNAAGYYAHPNMDLLDLFIGSEGTLGIIYEIKLKLLKKPNNFFSAVIFFNREANAFDFIEETRAISRLPNKYSNNLINALSIEYFDFCSLKFLEEDFSGIPQEAKAAVWVEQDIYEEPADTLFNDWLLLIKKHSGDIENSWVAVEKKDREKIKNFRHAISSKISDFISQNNLNKVGTDTATCDKHFRQYYYYSRKLVEQNNLKFVIYGHFGNSHMHLNMLPHNKIELDKAKKIYNTICKKAVELKGTISAEHGIGKFKTHLLEMMYGQSGVKEMAEIKKVFDKNLILNIGNVIDQRFLK